LTTQQVWRAMTLAPTIEICEALLRAESVPISLCGWKSL
jgi:hypothetical protein